MHILCSVSLLCTNQPSSYKECVQVYEIEEEEEEEALVAPSIWTIQLTIIKGQPCQDSLLLVSGTNLCFKVHPG